ncbi:S1 RNA binding family protein [Salegentibacter sp. 24]|uniref:S1 RNA-binding domain-containing protein n=1 Tax=Salegentibacter sp. 24 TaxID=2183986 RepID=UPI0010604D4D|nr:S1 RNA-binding domain-containing protein [Salegentibacter sp. 24]TDN93372.1 S1 RNA binding family protein [Salegentibacter sp. 24]
MEDKRNLDTRAKALIDSQPEEALKIYRQIWDNYPEQFNAYNGMFALKAGRKIPNVDIDFPSKIACKFPDSDMVNGIFGWLIFDRFIKGKSEAEILSYETSITEQLNKISQKNLREDNSYPCPFSIIAFKLADAFSHNMFNAPKVNRILDVINAQYLSIIPNTITTEKFGEKEQASDLEKYFALKTKALLKQNQFEDCISLSQQALEELDRFHYDNDLWFKMRIALCEEKLGNYEASEHLFKKLLSSKAGSSKWFLYRDIAELYFEQENYGKAWKFAVDAAFYGNEPKFLIGLYLLQAQILYKLDRPEDGKLLAELIAGILQEEGWRNKQEYNKLFDFYSIDQNDVEPLKKIYRKAEDFWISERYKGKPVSEGEIVWIHQRGKFGKIQSLGSNEVINFNKKDFRRRQRNLHDLNGARVSYIEMPSFDDSPIAENISILDNPTKKGREKQENVGKELKGKVKNVVPFGVFVKFKDLGDGLLHKSKLPNHLKNDFEQAFTEDQEIEVKIIKVTDKGIQLELIE